MKSKPNKKLIKEHCPSETTEHVSRSFQTPLYHMKWKDPYISKNCHYTLCGILVSSTP